MRLGLRLALFLLAFRHMRVPRMSGFGRDVGESGVGRRIRDANEMLTAGALNLPAGEMDFALQRLVAVGAVELEFGCFHRLYLIKRKSREKYFEIFHILFGSEPRLFG